MADPNTQILQPSASTPSGILHVDFNWIKNKVTITKDLESQPVYTAVLKTFSTTPLVFTNHADGKVFGTGRTHLISINADCTLNDKQFKLEATKRLKTRYTHQSQTLCNADGSPAQLYWSTETDYKKTWTFICTDDQAQPIVKLDIDIWAVKKFGKIEFAEGHHDNEELRREIVVAVVTLVYCMWVRMINVFALVGSALHRKPDLPEKTVHVN